MEYMLRYLVVPGRVENLCVIVDMKGVGLSQVARCALPLPPSASMWHPAFVVLSCAEHTTMQRTHA